MGKLSESGFPGFKDLQDVVLIFFVWCLGVVICLNQDLQDYRIFRIIGCTGCKCFIVYETYRFEDDI